MPDLKENIKTIEELRKLRDKADEELYLTQLELFRINRAINEAKRDETGYSEENAVKIAEIKNKISTLESELNELNARISEIESLVEKIKEKESYVQYLKDKIEAVKAKIESLKGKIKELERGKPLDERKIKEVREELEKLQALLSELQQSLSKAESDLRRLLEQNKSNTAEKRRLNEQKGSTTEEINDLKSELVELSTGKTGQKDLDEKYERLKSKYRENKNKLTEVNNGLIKAIDTIYVQQHPKFPLAELNDNIPFLLFPIRIETRFMTDRRQKELWLRVYPDDIAVYTHEKLLTSGEVDDGQLYWIRTFIAEFAPSEKESRKKAAWHKLASVFTPQRSAWIAKQTFPQNWQDLLTEHSGKDIIQILKNVDANIIDRLAAKLPDDETRNKLNTAVNQNNYSDFLKIIEEHELSAEITGTLKQEFTFPVHEMTKNSSWSRAPRTRILPDKFVVMIYQGDKVINEIIGKTIPDVLELGPDPLEPEDSFKTEKEKLVFGEKYSWTSDFEKAVEIGMGFRIPLEAPFDTRGFEKIVVLGLYLSSDEQQGKKEIEELIDNHHYSPKGFSIVPQGTPTNNTELDGSGYKSNDPFSDVSYYVETGGPLFDPANIDHENCNGKRLAEALGIDYGPLQYVQNSDGQDFLEARAMNTALYPATLGYYFESLLDPVFTEESKDLVRNFFYNYVTARGPVSAIRVGNQPYGILLTSDFSKWKWGLRGEIYNSSFLNKVTEVLSFFQAEWDKLVGQLMFVGKPGKDSSEVLMNILGLQPGSVSFYQRVGYSSEYLKNLDEFQWGGRYFGDLFVNVFKSLAVMNLFGQLGYNTKDSEGKDKKLPQLFKLIYQHYHTTLDSANLIDNNPLSEKDLIAFYDEPNKKHYINWLVETGTIEKLEKQDFGGAPVPTALLYMKLRHALLLQLHKQSSKWLIKRKIPVEHTMLPQNFYNIYPHGDLTKWEVMKAKIGTAEPSHTNNQLSIANYLLGPGKFEETDAEFLIEMRKSLEILARMPTARLERCFSEHVDLCSYRLDAWQTSLFSLRLKEQRDLDGKGERKKGIYIGAFGWVENVKPSKRTTVDINSVPAKLRPEKGIPVYEYSDNGGFVHAPSLNHASAAALLRSAYLSHSTKDNPELMSVNLSSERVRRALFILQGIRNGQRIEALLGFQFERGLHDRTSEDPMLNLNLYIYNFREAFPIKQNKIRQKGSDDASEETITTYDVVDGLILAEKKSAFPYGVTGLEGLNDDQKNAIIAEKDRLSDSLDAVKDLLISESAYQVVQGNFDRTGAVLNSMKDIQVPPEIDVINTPRSSHFTFTNRVTVHFDDLDPNNPASNPWPAIPMTPRAKTEPGLNKWLGSMMGDPDDIVCRVSHLDENDAELGNETVQLSNLSVQPIDLVYLIGSELGGGATEIENRIAYYYRSNNGIEDTVKIKIEFSKPENVPGKKPMAQVFPLIKMLKSLITDSKALNAEDFDPPTKKSNKDKNNPKGYESANIALRVQTAYDLLNSALDELKQIDISATINSVVVSKFSDAEAELQNNNLSFSGVPFIFNNSEAGELQSVLRRISMFGVSDAFPKLINALDDETKIILLEQGASILRVVRDYLDKAKDKIDSAAAEVKMDIKIKLYTEAAKFIFGDQFNILPQFYYNNEADIISSHNDRNQLLKHAKNNLRMELPADEWLSSTAHVRAKLHRWEMIRTIGEASGSAPNEPLPVQLPYSANDSWLAVEFPEKREGTNEPFQIMHDTISIVAHGSSAFSAGTKQAGFLLDDWTEVVPTNQEVTGITFNYNQPNAVPPQALLLVVTPEKTGSWKWDNLVGTLNDTLQRAKRRAIEPLILEKHGRSEINTLLPAVISEFNQHDLNVSLDYSINVAYIAQAVTAVMKK
jgi:predicted  nucleic acid-binding Zn-ribbon protein